MLSTSNSNKDIIILLSLLITLKSVHFSTLQEHYKFLYSLVAQTLQLRCKPVQEKDFVESYKKNNEPLESNPLLTSTEDAYEVLFRQNLLSLKNEPRREKTGFLHMRKQKTQISFAVTAKLISAFVFATRIV